MDAVASTPDLEVSLKGVGVPADGQVKLGQGVALHRLDVLFKGEAVVEGSIGQIQDASVRYEDGHMVLSVRVEDVESGEVLEEQFRAKCEMPDGAPPSGGPCPESIDEDDLDWEDEETLEQIMSPDTSGPTALPVSEGPLALPVAPARSQQESLNAEAEEGAEEEVPSSGMDRLLRALLGAEDDDEEEAREPDDQTMGVWEQGLGFLQILLGQDALEIEEGHEVNEIAEGVGTILSRDASSEVLAETLSNWLLEQPAVGDLFIGDEDLASMLEQW